MSKYVFVSNQKVLFSFITENTKEEKFFIVCLEKFRNNKLSDFFEHSDSIAWEKALEHGQPRSICNNQFILDVYNCLYATLLDEAMEQIEQDKEIVLSFRQC